MSRSPRALLRRLATWAAGAGLLGVAGAALGWALAPRAAAFGWHLAGVFWTGAALGCLALLLLHHLTGGRWGWAVRGPLEAGALTVPLLAAPFLIPLALGGLDAVFPFAQLPPGQGGHYLEHKRPYLNAPFYLGRNAGFFALWTVGGLLLARRGARPAAERLYPRLAGPGMVLLVLTVTFAAYDWIVALQPHVYSTIAGLYLLTGQALTAVAVVALFASRLPAPLGARPEAEGARLDVGNLLLVGVVLYTYCAFSQWLITWSGDKPHETAFYLERTRGAWAWVVGGLVAVHFVLPFFALLSRAVKRTPGSLFAVALLVLAARVVADAWMVLPVSGAPTGPLLACSAAALLGVGGLWVGALALIWSWRVEAGAAPEAPGTEEGEGAPEVRP